MLYFSCTGYDPHSVNPTPRIQSWEAEMDLLQTLWSQRKWVHNETRTFWHHFSGARSRRSFKTGPSQDKINIIPLIPIRLDHAHKIYNEQRKTHFYYKNWKEVKANQQHFNIMYIIQNWAKMSMEYILYNHWFRLILVNFQQASQFPLEIDYIFLWKSLNPVNLNNIMYDLVPIAFSSPILISQSRANDRFLVKKINSVSFHFKF